MIRSYGDRETESVAQRRRVRRLPEEIRRRAQRKLVILNNAADLNDLSAPPGNRLEKLSGNREGQYRIRINDQWRICFVWDAGDAYEVEIIDYHRTLFVRWREQVMRDSAPAKAPPIHPGEILTEEFLRPLNISQYRLAKSIGVDPRRIHAIANCERSITAQTALLLSRFFGNSPTFWMGIQTQYDLENAADALADQLELVVPMQTN